VAQVATEANPYMSFCEIRNWTRVPCATIHCTLKKDNFNSYKMNVHQQLIPRDADRRMEIVQTFLEMLDDDPNHVSHILFTNKKAFTFHRAPNKQNRYRWFGIRTTLYEIYVGKTQYWNKVNVWASILNDELIGPIFIEGKLTGPKYC